MNELKDYTKAIALFCDFFVKLVKCVKAKGGTGEMIESAFESDEFIDRVAGLVVGTKVLASHYLSLVQEGIQIATEVFSKSSFFSDGPKTYFLDNFRSWILSEIPDTIPAFQGTLSKYMLTKKMYDKEIRDELGNPTVFTVSELAAIMKDLITKQSKGKEGVLLTNNCSNIFYVRLSDGRVVAVCVLRRSVDLGWRYLACDLDVGQWGGSGCVFMRN